MNMSIDDLRRKLIQKILSAPSHHDLNSYIDTALKRLTEKKVHGHLIARFTEKTIYDLDSLTGTDHAMNQKHNISSAKERLIHFRNNVLFQSRS